MPDLTEPTPARYPHPDEIQTELTRQREMYTTVSALLAEISTANLAECAAVLATSYISSSVEEARAYYARIEPEELREEALDALTMQALYGPAKVTRL